MQLDCGRGCWTENQVLRQWMFSCLQVVMSEALASMLHRPYRLINGGIVHDHSVK
jgi:hypothetical protein